MLKHIKRITEALAVALVLSMIAAAGMHGLALILSTLPPPPTGIFDGWFGGVLFFGFLTAGSFLGFAVVLVTMAYTKGEAP